MAGIAIGVANVVVGICLRMQISWSRTHIDVGIQTCLFQIYPILLSTLLSVKRNQLSLFDADFALTITSSPLTVYLVFASIADLFRFRTGLYKRVTHRHINRTLLIGVLLIWLGLSLTLSLSNDAFIGSRQCDGSTFKDWFSDQFTFLQNNLILQSYRSSYGPLPLFLLLLGLCLFRRWSMISTDVRSFWKRSNPWGRLLIPWVFMKCAWCTIRRNHAWCIFYLFALLDILWILQVITAILDTSTGYELSYGQLLSLFATIPILISTFNVILLALRRVEGSPLKLIRAEIKYLLFGVGPEPSDQDNSLPLVTHQSSPGVCPSTSRIKLDDGEGTNSDDTALRLEFVAGSSVSLAGPERYLQPRLSTPKPSRHMTI